MIVVLETSPLCYLLLMKALTALLEGDASEIENEVVL